jgi:hypothetical protein
VSAPPPAGWSALSAELDAWQSAGRRASLWWRDDDAGPVSDALRRLVTLAGEGGHPLALAVVPAGVEAALARLVEDTPVAVLQHGFAHKNHAPAPAKKAELCLGAGRSRLRGELAMGRRRLEELFGARSLPVMVPPWNRYDRALLPDLVELRFVGLSTFGPRTSRYAATELSQVNAHVDPIDWHGHRGFIGAERTLGLLVDHLRARRVGLADDAEATGILTHHAVHDEALWDFLARLLTRLAGHPAARLAAASELFTGN